MIYSAIRRLLFLLDAESAHGLAERQILRLQTVRPLVALITAACRPPAQAAITLWDLDFPSPVGLAAGFDKNATMVRLLAALGFGFIEVGTVTLEPQAGNPRPRLFRFPAEHALVNRLGFNNDGARRVADRLEELRQSSDALPPIFVNVGKNRDVPLDGAAEAYAACYAIVGPHADGVVVNLSSPNTPGLRDLQEPKRLREILRSMRSVRESLPGAGRRQPILVKIAPDLTEAAIADICDVVARGADGVVATNTTTDHTDVPAAREVAGGLSGAPLFERSTEVLRLLRTLLGPAYPLVGVGGIMNAPDARKKMDAGANLVQLYTGFIYDGPLLPRRMVRELMAITEATDVTAASRL
jgi:dihydroorotate dehydrogenase